MTMPWSLRIMGLLGVVLALAGLPPLLRPATVRATFGLKSSPQMTYILRIVGTMLAALGLILLTFSAAFWRATLS